MKALPTADLYRYGNEVQRAMDDAVRNGEQVLLAHGTAWLVKAGSLDVPLDRANSILEVNVAHREADLGTLQRIKDRYYDRIFINSPWYGPRIEALIRDNYDKLAEIAFGEHPQGFERGYQGLFLQSRSTSKSRERITPDAFCRTPHLRNSANLSSSQHSKKNPGS